MSTSPKRVWSDQDSLWVELNDGRTIGVPLVWFPRLLDASSAEIADCELTPRGIHWDQFDEDVSIEGLLAGRGDRERHHDDAA